MDIQVKSKFNLGEFKKIKGSNSQKFLICEIMAETRGEEINIFYAGVLYAKKDSFGLTAKSWQAVGGIEKNSPEEWSLDKHLSRVSELLLEDFPTP